MATQQKYKTTGYMFLDSDRPTAAQGWTPSPDSRFAVLKSPITGWYAIIHRRSGGSCASLMPFDRGPTLAQYLNIIRAWEASDLDLSPFDSLPETTADTTEPPSFAPPTDAVIAMADGMRQIAREVCGR